MFDLKEYSVHEAIEYAKHRYNNPIVIGTTENRIHYYAGRSGSHQSYRFNGIAYQAHSFCHSTRKLEPNDNYEFSIKEVDGHYPLHYILERYQERLELDNVGYSYRIKKDGTKILSTKRYEFKDATLRIDVPRQEFKWYYNNHRYTKKINKNGTSEFLIIFNSGESIREYYNSKGVCTCSLLHFGDGETIQMHFKHKRVTFWCSNANGGRDGQFKTLVVPNIPDASIVNLYNRMNCFEIDLMMPSNEMFESYQRGLRKLKSTIELTAANCIGNKSLLLDMLGQIKAQEDAEKAEVQG
jgi:hypothetical protein